MNLKGITTYAGLKSLCNEMGTDYEFKHKKGEWTIKRFSVSFNNVDEIPFKTEVSYESNNRMYTMKIENLHKHFSIVEVKQMEGSR